MKSSKIIKIGRPIAIAVLVLGIIHNVATFTPLITEGLACLDQINLKAMTYMSLMCGTSLILSGALLLAMLKKTAPINQFRVPILIVGVFLAINGILAVVYMPENPFALLALILCMAMFYITKAAFNLKESEPRSDH